MKIWLTADNHFFHENCIFGHSEWGFRKFKNVEEMNQTMIDKWNEVVAEDDIVWHLGDFALANVYKIKEIISQLHGKIMVVCGNHDRANKLKRCGFTDVLKGVLYADFMYKGNKYQVALRHKPSPVKDVKYVLCGHSHEVWKVKKDETNIYINCGVDQWNYYPVALTDILDMIHKMESIE